MSYELAMKQRSSTLAWLLALLAAGFVFLLAARTRSAIERLDSSQRERASMLAHTLVATMQGVARHGPDAGIRIQAVLEEVTSSPSVRAVSLLDQHATPLFEGGCSDEAWTEWAKRDGSGIIKRGDELALLMPFELMVGQGRGGRAKRRQSSLATGSYAMLLVLDASSAGEVRTHIMVSDLGLLVIGLALTALGGLLLRSQARNHQLHQRIALQEQRRKGLESLRMLAAGLAHETRNPLGAIRGTTQLLHEASEDEQTRSRTALILEQIDHMTQRLDEFLAFAGKRLPRWNSVDLTDLAWSVLELLSSDAEAAGVELSVQDGKDPIVVEGDQRQLREALVNLVLNALQACSPGDEVRLILQPGQDAVCLTVEDTGSGIAPADLERVTEPYFTTRADGSGLGLAIVQRIAESHHAALVVTSQPDKGSQFTLRLPRELPRDE